MNQDRFIKKHIVGKRHSFLIKCPSGFKDHILPLVKQKILSWGLEDSPEVLLHERGLKVSGLKLREALELMFTVPLFTDVLLCLDTKKAGHESDLSGVDSKLLQAYLSSADRVGVILRNYRSIKRDEFCERLGKRLEISEVQFTSLDEKSDTYIESYFEGGKHKIYVSLSGVGLYRRGVKKYLHGDAPLREDYAANLLLKAFDNIAPGSKLDVLIPFAGSGTFGFEVLGFISGRVFHNYKNWYIYSDVFGLSKTIENLSAKNKPLTPFDLTSLHLVERDKNTSNTLSKNLSESTWGNFDSNDIVCTNADIFSDEFNKGHFSAASERTVFLPLNPPWGTRLGDTESANLIYKKSVDLIVDLSKTRPVCGFIICGTDSQWSLTSNALRGFDFELETLNYTQGGIHIRCLYFKKNLM